MADRLIFRCEGGDHPIALAPESAPRTLAALKAWLPAEVTIHCAKIAGCHIYWPTPILETLERGTDVHALPPGAFLYYPDRQYMELTYDALQAETAAVTLLGHLTEPLDWLRAFADTQRREHGQTMFTARLFFPGQDSGAAPPLPVVEESDSAFAHLRAGRHRAWAEEPAELRALLARDGLNIPFGPLATAEGEFRRTQELLWRLWRNTAGHDDPTRATVAREVLDLTLDRVVGYCHLTEAGAVLRAGRESLDEPDAPLDDAFREIITYCGRMSAWLDLHIPWWHTNEIVRRNHQSPLGVPLSGHRDP